MPISWAEFEQACRLLAESKTWTWNESLVYTALGYLSRTAVYHRRLEFDVDSDDDAAVSAGPQYESLSCNQYIVYSPTYQVPVLYFTMHDSNGTPLELSELVQTSLFRSSVLEGTELSSFAVTVPDSSFPLLSQGDHPTLGTPSWYLHPCQSAAAVDEIMAEIVGASQRSARWMDSWLLILGSVLDLNL